MTEKLLWTGEDDRRIATDLAQALREHIDEIRKDLRLSLSPGTRSAMMARLAGLETYRQRCVEFASSGSTTLH
jgi:hypothetical protein